MECTPQGSLRRCFVPFYHCASAVTLWFISWRSGQKAVNGMQSLAMESVEGVSDQLEGALITSVQSSLQTFVDRGESSVDLVISYLHATGVLSGNGTSAGESSWAVKQFQDMVFSMVKVSPWMFALNISVLSDIRDGFCVKQQMSFGWYNVNLFTRQLAPTLYSNPLYVNPYLNGTYALVCVSNTTTGKPELCLDQGTFPYRTPLYSRVPSQTTCQWLNTLSFAKVIGIPDTYLFCWVPFADRQAMVGV
eukprot:RCo017897